MSRCKIKYKFTCDIKPEGFSKEEIAADDASGCDAFLFASVIEDESGWTSTIAVGRDGRHNGDDISAAEIFKIWAKLAKGLSEGDLLPWQREIALRAFEQVRSAVVGEQT